MVGDGIGCSVYIGTSTGLHQNIFVTAEDVYHNYAELKDTITTTV